MASNVRLLRSNQRLRTRSMKRRGVSILEVLFAILITAIGLMGAIAVFPAALLQTKRGQQADATSFAGQFGKSMSDAIGMRRADRWLYWEASPASGSARYWQVTEPYDTTSNPPRFRNPVNGSWAFCIDPRFIASNQVDDTQRANSNNVPYGPTRSIMQRVTLNNGATGNTTYMSWLVSELNFRIEDDLAYDRFTDNLNNIDDTQHAASIFLKDSSGVGIKRQAHGHMSWMATFTPKIERAVTGTVEDNYLMSIVIFYDRPPQLDAVKYRASEWSLNVNMNPPYGGGVGGGDMLLSDSNTGLDAEERLRRVKIHRDQWILLMSYTEYTINGNTCIAPQCRWYRVVDADAPDASLYNVNVTLSGPDWEATGRPTFAVVFEGAVAVFEKTVKLEARK